MRRRPRTVGPGVAGAWTALLAALCALAPALCATPSAANGLSETIRRIKPSIVGVGSYQATRRPPLVMRGTGFVVADGLHVVTNHHVISHKLDSERKEFLCIIVGTGPNPRIVPVTVEATDYAHDVVILSFPSPRVPPLPLGDDRAVVEGQEIAFTGYPIGSALGMYPVTHRGIVSARTPIAIPQHSSRYLDPTLIRRLRNAFEVFQLDATAYPGNSGSPLYDQATGRVYGIVSSVFVKRTKENVLKDPSGITYAIPILHARNLLRAIGAAR